ncbi:MAG TPA: arginase family protein [Gemmatimonadaceae bacterium]|nr:arginase family protein [Gemmatimonadaceae bacterium]
MLVDVFAVPYDSGHRDTRMGNGPAHLLASGVFDGARTLGAKVTVRTYEGPPNMLRAEAQSAFDIQRWLAERVTESRLGDALPIALAGNCMAALGMFAGLRAAKRKPPVICWFDAHGDFNTPETTEGGYLDGMALAVVAGKCWTRVAQSVPGFKPVAEESVAMFGTRNLDPLERTALNASGIHWRRTSRKPEPSGDALLALRQRSADVYLHVDLDALDESEGRVNQYSSPGGLTHARLVELVREIASTFRVVGMAITAYDPSVDPDGRIPPVVREIVDAIVTSASR